MPKIRNIIIFATIGAILVLIYIFFIKSSSDEDVVLISSVPAVSETTTTTSGDTSVIAQEFLTLLLSVKGIKLNDAIFSTNAFNSLRDSSIVLVPDGNEGRPNPFAPIGVDIVVSPPSTTPPLSTTPTTPTTPPLNP